MEKLSLDELIKKIETKKGEDTIEFKNIEIDCSKHLFTQEITVSAQSSFSLENCNFICEQGIYGYIEITFILDSSETRIVQCNSDFKIKFKSLKKLNLITIGESFKQIDFDGLQSQQARLLGSKLENINIKNCEFGKFSLVDTKQIDKRYINIQGKRSFFNDFRLSIHNRDVSIQNVTINHLTLKGNNNSDFRILINNINLHTLELSTLYNGGIIDLTDINIMQKFQISPTTITQIEESLSVVTIIQNTVESITKVEEVSTAFISLRESLNVLKKGNTPSKSKLIQLGEQAKKIIKLTEKKIEDLEESEELTVEDLEESEESEELTVEDLKELEELEELYNAKEAELKLELDMIKEKSKVKLEEAKEVLKVLKAVIMTLQEDEEADKKLEKIEELVDSQLVSKLSELPITVVKQAIGKLAKIIIEITVAISKRAKEAKKELIKAQNMAKETQDTAVIAKEELEAAEVRLAEVETRLEAAEVRFAETGLDVTEAEARLTEAGLAIAITTIEIEKAKEKRKRKLAEEKLAEEKLEKERLAEVEIKTKDTVKAAELVEAATELAKEATKLTQKVITKTEMIEAAKILSKVAKLAEKALQISQKEKTALKILNSRLGNATFKNINLSEFSSIEIKNTDLSSLKTFKSTFPTESKIIKGKPKELYEIFNDLYTSSKNKNDKSEELEYYRASKNYLLKYLFNKDKFASNFSSLISLLISKWYSNFGTSFLQAALITSVISLIFFSFMLYSVGYTLELNLTGLDYFLNNLVAYWIQYINPIHRIDFMKEINVNFSENSLFVLFDFFGRIFISIGIFETIRSFRKLV